MWSEPAIRAPFKGCFEAYSSRNAIRPGISVSASLISMRRNRQGDIFYNIVSEAIGWFFGRVHAHGFYP